MEMLSCNLRFMYVKKKNVNEFQIYYVVNCMVMK